MDGSFQRGDRVCTKGLQKRVGVVAGDGREMRGAVYYPVSFDPREESKWLLAASLEVFVKPKGVADLVRERERADAGTLFSSLRFGFTAIDDILYNMQDLLHSIVTPHMNNDFSEKHVENRF